jgi:putative nucleotidyltransferase with HDIG domain
MQLSITELSSRFNKYYDSFTNLSPEDQKNFGIKKDHSFRVAKFSRRIAEELEFNDQEKDLVFFIGLFHDIGRFEQLNEFGTFDDSKSVDHAEYSVKVLSETGIIELVDEKYKKIVQSSILNHNKFKINKRLKESDLQYARIIRDADKMDILKVLSEYYSNRNSNPNHTLTWELPKGIAVSKAVWKEVLANKLVSRKNVMNEIDVKIMQMSWVYDLNFKTTFEHLLKKRFLESIYDTLPKNDTVLEIYKRVKMYATNKTFSSCKK